MDALRRQLAVERVDGVVAAGMAGRVVVVGLGPAGAEYLLPAARAAIAAAPAQARFVRTARHPAVEQLAAEGLTFVASRSDEPS